MGGGGRANSLVQEKYRYTASNAEVTQESDQGVVTYQPVVEVFADGRDEILLPEYNNFRTGCCFPSTHTISIRKPPPPLSHHHLRRINVTDKKKLQCNFPLVVSLATGPCNQPIMAFLANEVDKFHFDDAALMQIHSGPSFWYTKKKNTNSLPIDCSTFRNRPHPPNKSHYQWSLEHVYGQYKRSPKVFRPTPHPI